MNVGAIHSGIVAITLRQSGRGLSISLCVAASIVRRAAYAKNGEVASFLDTLFLAMRHLNLINTKTLRQIGSAEFENRAGDFAALQDEGVSRLARLMGIAITPEMLNHRFPP